MLKMREERNIEAPLCSTVTAGQCRWEQADVFSRKRKPELFLGRVGGQEVCGEKRFSDSLDRV